MGVKLFHSKRNNIFFTEGFLSYVKGILRYYTVTIYAFEDSYDFDIEIYDLWTGEIIHFNKCDKAFYDNLTSLLQNIADNNHLEYVEQKIKDILNHLCLNIIFLKEF